jgi:hypothetical protein
MSSIINLHLLDGLIFGDFPEIHSFTKVITTWGAFYRGLLQGSGDGAFNAGHKRNCASASVRLNNYYTIRATRQDPFRPLSRTAAKIALIMQLMDVSPGGHVHQSMKRIIRSAESAMQSSQGWKSTLSRALNPGVRDLSGIQSYMD